MKKKIKYLVTVKLGTFQNADDISGFDWKTHKIKFEGADCLAQREKAFKYIDNFEESLEWKEWGLEHIPIGNSPSSESSEHKAYEITVALITAANDITIYETDPLDPDLIFFNLEKEYKILKDIYKLNLNEVQQKVEYFDYKTKKNKTLYILPNKMNWENYKANVLHSEEFKAWVKPKPDSKDKKKSKKATAKNPIAIALKKGECQTVEFKSTLKTNLHTKIVDPLMELEVVKTIAAFINKSGGILLIGVGDKREILGLESDMKACKNSHDVFRQSFDNILKKYFDNYGSVNNLIEADFVKIKHKEIFSVKVNRAAASPVFIKTGDQLFFYVRGNANTRSLNIKEALAHIIGKWPDYKG
jgi:hypothetical protein